MSDFYLDGEILEGIDYSKNKFEIGEYENCTFVNCNFNKTDLSGNEFVECEFLDCDLSMVKLYKTFLKEVRFNNCNLTGVVFSDCDRFLLSIFFNSSVLNFASFYAMDLRTTTFEHSKLVEVDFTDTNLLSCTFNGCDLNRAIFDNTNLESADFTTSFNYSIDPENNRLKKTRFSKDGIIGLLDKYDIEVE